MDLSRLIILFVLLTTCLVSGQSTYDNFNQISGRSQQQWPQQRQQYYGGIVRSQPAIASGFNYNNNNFNEILKDASFQNLPNAFSALNSIRYPASGSTNNVIGNTAYNTVGNRNSLVQNNP